MHGFHTKNRRAKGYADGGHVEEEVKQSPQDATQQPKPSDTKSKPVQPESLGNGLAYKAAKALKDRRAQLDEQIDSYANGGMVKGPGTGTSDDIQTEVDAGSYIMPADSTEKIGEQALGGLGFKPKVPVNLSNGEYQLPPEQVHAVGVQALDQMKDATHAQVAPKPESQAADPEMFFADGGEVEDPRRRMYVNSAGQASNTLPSASREVVPYQGPGTQAAATSPAPQLNTVNQSRLSGQRTAGPVGALPAPEPRGPTDFYTNRNGTTARGFAPSSSTAMVPAGPLVDQTQRLALPAPEASRAPGAQQPINYQARAESMARAKADSAKYLAEKAAQDARFANAQPGAAPASPASGFRANLPKVGAGGALAGALTAIPEAVNVYDVAKDPNATKLDVATQGAEGAAKVSSTLGGATLGAKGGAALGALGGPLSPVTVPAGALIGGIVGGGIGYFGADKAIKAGRSLLGGDEASPIDRVQQQQAAAQPVQQAAPAVQPSAQGASQTPAQAAVQPQTTEPVEAIENNITRVGNSFSGRNISAGFTVNGRPAGESIQPRSAQNQAAVDALFARTPELSSVPSQPTPVAEPAGFQPRGGMTVIRDSSGSDRERQRLINAASTPYAGAQKGQLTANQLRTLAGLQEADQRTELARETNAANNETRLTETQMQTGSANERAVMQEMGANSRAAASNSLDSQRLNDERESRGFQARAAQRVEKLYEKYEKAAPEDRAAISQQIRDLTGKSSSTENLKNNFMTRKVPAMDAAGNVVGERDEIVDLRTGQPLGAQASQSPRPVGTTSTVNGKTAVWDGSKWVQR